MSTNHIVSLFSLLFFINTLLSFNFSLFPQKRKDSKSLDKAWCCGSAYGITDFLFSLFISLLFCLVNLVTVQLESNQWANGPSNKFFSSFPPCRGLCVRVL
ncbi:hypothetical protein B9Z19DRAFT_572636 [Tuber borchii]|uniref:Uncharacterized protein n=1 Tax=Tuber borchii TaxID=42251 RepID=A0A2T7A1W8_TUBBO|nr:hypothetical protein B9Z19DRAFT_572636 [Tuber borchii]